MKPKVTFARVLVSAFVIGVALFPNVACGVDSSPEIRTPSAPLTPRINGPSVFGVRSGNPFFYHIPVSERGFSQARWRAFSGPGHWNDPDMLEIGTKEPDQPGLTPDEEYTHMTLWSLVCAPLLLGADMETMSPFTLNLLTNDEVLAVNQDAFGDQAVAVARDGDMRVYAKKLEDGSMAVGLFNLSGKDSGTVTVKWSDLNVNGSRSVRDLWRQKDLGAFNDRFSMSVAQHGAELVKISR